MTGLFAWIEQTPLSIWVREDFYAFFWILIAHSLGIAFLAGGGLAVSLRTIGVARGAALEKFRGFFPVMWAGLALASVSGVLLVIGYPAKALTNPVLAVKFALLLAAGLMVREIARRLFPRAAAGEPPPPYVRTLGYITLALWLAGVFAGKMLPYTHRVLMVS